MPVNETMERRRYYAAVYVQETENEPEYVGEEN